MESNHNNNLENKNSKEKNKSIPTHKQFLDDSETYENSTKYKADNSEKYNSLTDLNHNFKKSMGFFTKKIYIEKPEIEEEKQTNNRKYSMEEHLIIKDFVPQLRPIEIHLVPSKLRLNKKSFKNFKSNNSFISCPNSEDDSDICLSPEKNSPIDKNANIKNTRKILEKWKSGCLPKIMSRNLIESNCKKYKDELNIEFDSEKDSIESDDNLLLYDDNDFLIYNKSSDKENNKENKKGNKKENEEHGVRNNRMNSCSILDVLKNKIIFDDTI